MHESVFKMLTRMGTNTRAFTTGLSNLLNYIYMIYAIVAMSTNWVLTEHAANLCDFLTGSAVMGLNSKLTGVGLVPGEETVLEVGDSGTTKAVPHC